MDSFDLRIVQAVIAIDGETFTYENMGISSTGTKFASPLQNQAEIKITNIAKSEREFLLSQCSPYNKNVTAKTMTLNAGKVSTGAVQIFSGNIITCDPSEPPDITLTFKSKANQFQKGSIVSVQQPSLVSLSKIAGDAAATLGLTSMFQADDKSISNYGYSGNALGQLGKIQEAGGVAAYIDGNNLIVKNTRVPLTGVKRILSGTSGMIGIPKLTEQGVKITYFLDAETKIGGGLEVNSEIYPSIDGNYCIFKLGWNIAYRETPFYWIADALRINDNGQVQIPNGIKKHKGRRR
jgi:hypothetical protein